jgi:hypothetical protein
MKKENKLILTGCVFLLFGIGFLFNSFTITGAAIGVSSSYFSFFGFIFIFCSIFILMAGSLEKRIIKTQKNLIEEIKSKSMKSYGYLLKCAKKMGYQIKEGGNHTKVYQRNKLVTTIPRHSERKGTYFNIVKKLVYT